MSQDRDTFDVEAARKRKDILRRSERREVDNAICWLMKHAPGRRVVWTLLEDARVFSSSFDPDPYVVAFREGRRDFGLSMLNIVMGASSSLYAKMVQECGKEDDGNSNE